MIGACGHKHEGLEQAAACGAKEELASACPGAAVMVVVHGRTAAGASFLGNETAFAAMLSAGCKVVLRSPRPDTCAACGEAWDRIADALLILDGAPRSCQ